MAAHAPPAILDNAEKGRRRQEFITGKPPRISPLDREAHAAEIVALTTALRDDVAGQELPPVPLEFCPELVPTLMRHPELWKRFSSLSAIVQCATAKIPPRERQLMILRTVWLCGAPYQWGEHVERTKQAGFSAEDVERIKEGANASGWNAPDKALLRAVDELHADAFVSDETWNALAQRFDENQMFELLALIGQFTCAAYVMNSLRLRLEPHNKGFSA